MNDKRIDISSQLHIILMFMNYRRYLYRTSPAVMEVSESSYIAIPRRKKKTKSTDTLLPRFTSRLPFSPLKSNPFFDSERIGFLIDRNQQLPTLPGITSNAKQSAFISLFNKSLSPSSAPSWAMVKGRKMHRRR